MLIVGLIFLGVIGLGELSKWAGHRRADRRRARRQAYYPHSSLVRSRTRLASFLPRLTAMPPLNLRDWIALLEREGELARVGVEVDPRLEITEIVDRTV